mmetsp:Transcript_15677/g.29756  ORF Transcript_15677/g.29756 Transcript_15677/m.29756 type:complete len:81 (-) Transcript_15677:85-327(-)
MHWCIGAYVLMPVAYDIGACAQRAMTIYTRMCVRVRSIVAAYRYRCRSGTHSSIMRLAAAHSYGMRVELLATTAYLVPVL